MKMLSPNAWTARELPAAFTLLCEWGWSPPPHFSRLGCLAHSVVPPHAKQKVTNTYQAGIPKRTDLKGSVASACLVGRAEGVRVGREAEVRRLENEVLE